MSLNTPNPIWTAVCGRIWYAKRGAWLVEEKYWRCCKEVMNVAQNNLLQRLIGLVRNIQKGASHAEKESARTGDVGVPSDAEDV